MKLETINVSEYISDSIASISSFSKDEEGYKQAEEIYRRLINLNSDNVTDEEMDTFIEDGYYEFGNYQVFLTYSNKD